jgi:hypothetical protein
MIVGETFELESLEFNPSCTSIPQRLIQRERAGLGKQDVKSWAHLFHHVYLGDRTKECVAYVISRFSWLLTP